MRKCKNILKIRKIFAASENRRRGVAERGTFCLVGRARPAPNTNGADSKDPLRENVNLFADFYLVLAKSPSLHCPPSPQPWRPPVCPFECPVLKKLVQIFFINKLIFKKLLGHQSAIGDGTDPLR